MTLRNRLETLERRSPSKDGSPIVILFRIFSPDDPANGWPGQAHILAGPHGDAACVIRGDDEAEAAFMERAGAEVLRIHGRLPKNWTC